MTFETLEKYMHKGAYLAYKTAPQEFKLTFKLKQGATDSEINKTEKKLGFKLPQAVKKLYSIANPVEFNIHAGKNIFNKNSHSFFFWSLDELLKEYKNYKEQHLQYALVEDLSQDEIKKYYGNIYYLQKVENLTAEKIRDHQKMLLPITPVTNGDKICVRVDNGEVYYLNHDPGPGYEGVGLMKLTTDIISFYETYAQFGFLGHGIEEIETYFIKKPTKQDILIRDTIKKLEVPVSFIEEYFTNTNCRGFLQKLFA